MKTIRKITSLFLALVIIQISAIACGDTDSGINSAPETSSETTAAAETTAADGETDRSQIKDNLPDDLDFEGQEVRILYRSDGAFLDQEIFSDTDTGEVVDTAIYRRNMSVEERLNIKIVPIGIKCDIHSGAEVSSKVKKSVTSGSDDYDIAANHMSQMTPLAVSGMYTNLMALDYLDFDQPWWATDFMKNLTIYDKCYMMAGDIGLSMIESTYILYYNKVIYENYFPGTSMYDIINNNIWIIDKMAELSRTVYSDLNGNNEADKDDQYGYYADIVRTSDGMLGSCNIQFVEINESGDPYFVLEQNERTFEFIEKVHSLLYDDNQTFIYNSTGLDTENTLGFISGKALFFPYTMFGAAYLRDMENDWGIIPMPKLNEEQDKYYTTAHNGFTAFAILSSCKYPDIAAAFCEAMSSESYRSVTPAYYETALKEKYSRDPETQAMIDQIHSSLYFDFAYVNSANFADVMQQFRDLVQKNKDQAASALAKKMTQSAKLLKNTLNSIRNWTHKSFSP